MATAIRSGRGVRAVRLKPSQEAEEAASRALLIATRLREPGPWNLTRASVCQGWTVQLDGVCYRIDAYAMAFLDQPRKAGFVFSVTIRSARAKGAIQRVPPTPWFQGVQARLGADYITDNANPERLQLVRILRGTTDTSTVFDELRHIAAAIEGKSLARRRRRLPSRSAAGMKGHRANVWSILDALSRARWRVNSIAQELQRRLQHDRCQWQVSMSFTVVVGSAENHPGFGGTVHCWPRTEHTKRRSPLSKVDELIHNNGYRRVDDTHHPDEAHYLRWHRGLGLRAATREIELLGRAMRLMMEASSA